MSTVLVTGASGLIGARFLGTRSGGDRLIALSRRAAPSNAEHCAIDLSDPAWKVAQLPAQVDSVVHLAQSEQFRDFPNAALPIFRVNTESTLKLLDWARTAGVRRFILASTGGVYAPSDQPLLESSPIAPLGFYASSKYASELIAQSYAPHLTVIILRFFFVYGAGQKEQMLIPRLIRSVIAGQPIQLAGQDGLEINPTHASDATRAIDAALRLDQSEVLHVAGPETLSLRAIAEQIGRAVGQTPRFDIDPTKPSPRMVADTTRMRARLVAPELRFSEGVRRLIPTGA